MIKENKSKIKPVAKDKIKGEIKKPSLFDYFKKIRIKMLITTLVIAGLFLGLFFGTNKIFAQKIYPGVRVLGIHLGGKSKEQAQTILVEKITQIDATGTSVSYNGTLYKPTLSQLGYTLSADQLAQKAYSIGKDQYPLFALLNYQNLKVEPPLDETKFKECINTKFGSLNIPSQDASFKIENRKVILIEGKDGQEIDWENLKELLSRNMNKNNGQPTELKTVIKKPTIQNSDILKISKTIEARIDREITLFDKEKNKTFKITPEIIGSWLKLTKENDRNNNIKVDFDQDKIKNYLNDQIVSQINVTVKDRKVAANDENNVLDEGRDGRTLDIEQTVTAIIKAIDSNSKEKINLKINIVQRKTRKVYDENVLGGRFPGKYIEIVLSQQALYCFEGENLINKFTISTGKWSMPTPRGQRAIYSKTERAWSETYGLYMPWWNDIGGGYGIHELPEWPGGAKEGEGHLGIPVSHGCVRLGVGAAQWVYDWAPIGTPVFID